MGNLIEESNPETVIFAARIEPETRAAIRRLAKETHRGVGKTVDWLVGLAMEGMAQINNANTTVDQAISIEEELNRR